MHHSIPHRDAHLAAASERLIGLSTAISAIRSISDDAQPLPGLRAAIMSVQQQALHLTLEAQQRAIPIAARAGADLATYAITNITATEILLTLRAHEAEAEEHGGEPDSRDTAADTAAE